MFERVKLFIINASAHLWLYTIPRVLHSVFVRLPVTILDFLTGRRPLTYSFKRDRHIKVVTSSTNAAASGEIRRLCGLHGGMEYKDPMYNGVVQTVLAAMRLGRRVQYDRELIDADDGNPICLDWLRVPQGRKGEVKGVILLVPGFGNYGQTPFIQRFAREAVRHGYHVCVLTPRGMGSAPLTKPRLTCVTFTADVRTVLRSRFTRDRLRADFGRDLSLYALGYSAGGSTLIKAIAEESASPDFAVAYRGGFPIRLCIAVNSPFDMVVHAEAMLSRVGRLLFQQPMLTALRKFTEKHWEMLRHGIPGLPTRSEAEMKERLRHLVTVEDFEEHVLCPHMGYPHAVDYYNDAYAPTWARQVRDSVTLLCVASRHDPVVGYGVTDDMWQAVADTHPNVAYVETPAGGHLGYLCGPFDEFSEKPSFLTRFPLGVMDTFTKESSRA